MPKISVITTTYKHQDFIAQTIESILSQTYPDRELLIGDDSPDDATRNIIQGYVVNYPDKIKARHHSPNKGIVDNMNFLIAQVSESSEYIAFLEGDDMYTPENLNEKIKIFERYPKLGMIYNNFATIDKHSNKRIIDGLKDFVPVTKYIQNEILPKVEFMNGDYYGSYSTLMITKDANKKQPIRSIPNGSMSYVSDWDMFLRIANEYKIYGTEKVLTHYRLHDNNFSRVGGNIVEGLEELLTYYKKNDELSHDEDRKIQPFYAKLAIWNTAVLQMEGKNSEAWKSYQEARGYDKNISFAKVKCFIRFFMPVSLQKYIYQKFFFKHA